MAKQKMLGPILAFILTAIVAFILIYLKESVKLEVKSGPVEVKMEGHSSVPTKASLPTQPTSEAAALSGNEGMIGNPSISTSGAKSPGFIINNSSAPIHIDYSNSK